MQHYLQKSLALLVLASTTLFAVPTDAEVSDIMVNFTVGDTVTSQGCVITINNGNPVTLSAPSGADLGYFSYFTSVPIDVSACEGMAVGDSFTLGISGGSGPNRGSQFYNDMPGGGANEAASATASSLQIYIALSPGADCTSSGSLPVSFHKTSSGLEARLGGVPVPPPHLCVIANDMDGAPDGIYDFNVDMVLTN